MSYARPARLAYVEGDPADDDKERVYLLLLPDGRPVLLEGSAAVIWLTAAQGADDVGGAVAGRFGVPREKIEDEVISYLTVLCAQGLLEPLPGPEPAT